MGQSNSRSTAPSLPQRSRSDGHPTTPRPASRIFRTRSEVARGESEQQERTDQHVEALHHQRESAPSPQPRHQHTSPTPNIARRPSSLSRARSSFANSIPRIFARSASSTRGRDTPRSPSTFDVSLVLHEEAETIPNLPSLQVPDLSPNSDPSPRLSQSDRHPASTQARPGRRTGFPAPRISSLTSDRTFRNLSASLRRRRSPPRREDHAAMLSRLLSVAAAATAASLVGGNPETAVSDLRNATTTVDGDDGTFDGFLQALRSGRLASAMGQTEQAGTDEADPTNSQSTASLDFFRMFRFGSDATGRQVTSATRGGSDRMSDRTNLSPANEPSPQVDDASELRMVPILIVGIRSLNNDGVSTTDGTEAIPSFLDALTNFPTTINIGLSDSVSEDASREPRNGLRISQRRRASMGGFNLFSNSNRDAARQRSATRAHMAAGRDAFESPPGPFPPPTTPASPPLSSVPSGTSTPMHASSSYPPVPTLARHDSQAPDRHTPLSNHTDATHQPHTNDESLRSSRTTRQRRRMSDSDGLGFGFSSSSRRHGIHLEPHEAPAPPPEPLTPGSTTAATATTTTTTGDATPSTSPTAAAATAEANRSWIIYVLGGSYPENHPILTTPSLFTDSPTYEDMLLLSSLLGPAKPPVAAAEDVASAPGLLRVIAYGKDGTALRAVAAAAAADEKPEQAGTDIEPIPHDIAAGERCLVCLCDYAAGDEARRLVGCGHLFHRECIDEWLTTGRNSCPLCRGEGVHEKANPDTTSSAGGGASVAESVDAL